MKKMFKIALVALVGALGYTANAQEKGITIKGGVNFNTVYFSEKQEGLENKVGFHIGALYEIPVADIIAVEAGVLFDTRGFKIERNVDNASVKSSQEASTNVYSLNIPVVGKVKIGVSDVNIFLQAGPYANILLSGTQKTEISTTIKALNTTTKESSSDSIEFGENKDLDSRFDYGLTFGAGVELKRIVFSVGYDLGLKNFGDNNDKARFDALKIGVGYKF